MLFRDHPRFRSFNLTPGDCSIQLSISPLRKTSRPLTFLKGMDLRSTKFRIAPGDLPKNSATPTVLQIFLSSFPICNFKFESQIYLDSIRKKAFPRDLGAGKRPSAFRKMLEIFIPYGKRQTCSIKKTSKERLSYS